LPDETRKRGRMNLRHLPERPVDRGGLRANDQLVARRRLRGDDVRGALLTILTMAKILAGQIRSRFD
jgi:hypothetical protein